EDRIFYEGGGGVTISGGEPLMQSDFCEGLLCRLKAEGVHCAVDTCGNVPWSAFVQVMPFTDLFLYDFKCAEPDKHRVLTGGRNERILENLVRLDRAGKAVELRMVMVPGHNMEESDIQGAAEFLAPLKNITAVRLLAYHSLARAKFRAVGHRDTMPDVPSPTFQELETVAETLRSFGLKTINPLQE
ncbi:MAG: radical SAM protein, partial [Victivallales bacterium]|nr:radical SAM protein [Victivallales bacterium]